MSSGSPGRYQSRLFNFLNRQSLRLTAQCDRAVRHLKVAAVWGAQILLYPMYLLVQASLSAGRQLSSAAQAGWPQLKATPQQPETPPASDTPIQRVLSEVNSLELQVERSKVGHLLAPHQSFGEDVAQVDSLDQSSPLQPPNLQPSALELSTLKFSTLEPSTPNHLSQTAQESSEDRCLIQGVATVLATRTLVLVTVENEILDILTPQQQQKLSSKISWEVADLLRQRRLAQSSERQKVARPLTTLEQPRVFLPLRLFWHLMAWVQTSPVAVAANVFQESTLVHQATAQPSQIQPRRRHRTSLLAKREQGDGLRRQLPASNNQVMSLLVAPQSAIAFLDRTVAELESHQLVPGSEVVITLSERATTTLRELRLTTAIRERTQKLRQQMRSPFITTEGRIESPEASQTNTFRIQSLIYAAIDYFFGRRGSNLPGTASQKQQAIRSNFQGQAHRLWGRNSASLPSRGVTPNLELTDAGEPDPWLSLSDLFGNPDPQGLAQNPHSRTTNPKAQVQLPEAFNSKIPVKPGNSVWGALKRYLSPKPSSEKLTPSRQGELSLDRSQSVAQLTKPKTQGGRRSTAPTKGKTLSSTVVPSRNKSLSATTQVATALTPPSTSSQHTDLEPAPDWIETQATPTGYVKHPLEQLLEWLDTAMLWLEELVVNAWRWVRQLGRRR